MVSSKAKDYADILFRGSIAEMAPGIVQGALIEMLKAKKVNVAKASKWVNDNISLWETLEPEEQNSLLQIGEYVVNLDWLTVGWVIGAIRRDLPAVASLFIGWRKGTNWLERQVTQIKKEIST